MTECDPIEHLKNFLRLWWLMLAAALLGGLVGFIYSRSHAPVYEAVATYLVEINLDKVPEFPLDMYDKDMALASTEGALASNDVLNDVFAEAIRLGQSPEEWSLLANTTIERRHAFWELRFRHTDPAFAQTLVNFWAEKGYQAMLKAQQEGKTPSYVVFFPPTLAELPQKAVFYDTNKLVLAGSMAGWVISLLLVELAGQRLLSRRKSS